MIRLDGDDGAVLAMLAQFQDVPLSLKRKLVSDLSPKAKPIGNFLIGQSKRQPGVEVKKAAERLRKWAQSNRRNHSKRAVAGT